MDKPTKDVLLPVLVSLPISNRLNLPPREELLSKIESGELDHLDFEAQVFGQAAQNRNPYRFRDEDMNEFARSFEGQPYLRDHDTYSIDSRDGTIISSSYKDSWVYQDIRLTTRRGMIDYVEGKIDRFSIGWFYDDATCSICGNSFFSRDCSHWPGLKYRVDNEEVTCLLIFVNPKGKETSAVNVPAVQGTGIVGALAECKLSMFEGQLFEVVPDAKGASAPMLSDNQQQEAQELRERINSILRKD